MNDSEGVIMNRYEKVILEETKGLPFYKLNEILDFIRFVKMKSQKKTKKAPFNDNLNYELNLMNKSELSHLEDEFIDYKEIYPHEK